MQVVFETTLSIFQYEIVLFSPQYSYIEWFTFLFFLLKDKNNPVVLKFLLK